MTVFLWQLMLGKLENKLIPKGKFVLLAYLPIASFMGERVGVGIERIPIICQTRFQSSTTELIGGNGYK